MHAGSKQFLCWDRSTHKDVEVNLIRHANGSREVELWQHRDPPFETGFQQRRISEAEFPTARVNGQIVADLIEESERRQPKA